MTPEEYRQSIRDGVTVGITLAINVQRGVFRRVDLDTATYSARQDLLTTAGGDKVPLRWIYDPAGPALAINRALVEKRRDRAQTRVTEAQAKRDAEQAKVDDATNPRTLSV